VFPSMPKGDIVGQLVVINVVGQLVVIDVNKCDGCIWRSLQSGPLMA
jgi:hypothetical protein